MKKWFSIFLVSILWFFFLFFIQNDNLLTIHMPIKISSYLFYILTSISIFLSMYSVITLHEEYSFHETKEYNRYLIVYYFFFQGIFACLSLNIFLSFSCSVITLLSSLFLYYESKSYDKDCSKYLWFSLYYNLILCILLLITYFMNL